MTTIKQDFTHVSFHEATLTDIVRRGSTVSFVLEDVRVADIQKTVKVTVEGVVAVLRDGSPVVDLRMEEEDGEVLTFRKESGQALLAVEWNSFAAKKQRTVVYTFVGSPIILHVAGCV